MQVLQCRWQALYRYLVRVKRLGASVTQRALCSTFLREPPRIFPYLDSANLAAFAHARTKGYVERERASDVNSAVNCAFRYTLQCMRLQNLFTICIVNLLLPDANFT